MRLIVLPLCAFVMVGAASPATPDALASSPTRSAELQPGIEQTPSDRLCAGRIEQVRDADGEPRLDRAPANAETPMLIAAVDKRIEGCAVLQMKGDVNDLRPVPPPSVGPATLKPAR